MYDLDFCNDDFYYDDDCYDCETVSLESLAEAIQEIRTQINDLEENQADLEYIAKVLDLQDADDFEIEQNRIKTLESLEPELEDLESEFYARSNGLTPDDYI